jgi:hypothetical protein
MGRRKKLDTADICRAYLAGEGPTSIGRRHGVTDMTIRNRLRDAGVQMRPAFPRQALELHAARLGIGDGDLDDLVHQVVKRQSAGIVLAVNDSGVSGQIAYLIKQMGFQQLLAVLDEYGRETDATDEP